MALGAGPMKQSTTIEILVLKRHVRHKQLNNEIAKIPRVSKENAAYQNGCNKHLIEMPRRH